MLLLVPATPALADPPAPAQAPRPSARATAPGAPPAPAPPASSKRSAPGPLSIVNGAGAKLQPFGPGTRISVHSSKLVKLYVARALPDGSRPPDYNFTRVGTAPLDLQLPPGTYVVEVENDNVSRAGHLLHVGSRPVDLDVNPGSSGLNAVGTLSFAIGTLSVLAASVLLLSGSEVPAGIKKGKLVIPMYAAGGALVIGGLTLYLVTRTSIDERPGGVPQPVAPRRQSLALHARVAF